MNTTENLPRIVFAGDRRIAVDVLLYLQQQGIKPLGLMLPERRAASHANELLSLCSDLDSNLIWYGKSCLAPETVERLGSLKLDYIICIHFPLIIPKAILNLPKEGVLNLHPALLPYNRGWHTSIWALLDKTPYGATLHFMDEKVDTGDIVHQKELVVSPTDTGDTLYKRALYLELEVFKEAWPQLANHSYNRRQQQENLQTTHKRKDLASQAIQKIDLDATVRAGDLIDKMRALTTNRFDEASYFIVDGRKYFIQIAIQPEHLS